MAVFFFTAGEDHFTGAPGEDNVFFGSPATLDSFDSAVGTASAQHTDTFVGTDAGAFSLPQFRNVVGIESIELAPGGNSVRLDNRLVAEASGLILSVRGAAGNDRIDASAVTNGRRVAFYSGTGDDIVLGGSGNDYFAFTTAALTAADIVSGGRGFDYFDLLSHGTVVPSAFDHVSGIDVLMLNEGGNAVTLTNGLLAGTDDQVLSVFSGHSDDVIDASLVTNGIRVAFYARGGADTFIGGNGSDYLLFAPNGLTAHDRINGGANFDIIEFSFSGFVGNGAFTNVTGVDELILHKDGSTVTLVDAMVAGTDNGVLVIIDGVGNDSVDASAVTANRVVFAATSGEDRFTGGGGSDVALFDVGELAWPDSFVGGAGFDILQLTTAGALEADAFRSFFGVDELFLTLAGNAITLSGGIVGNSDDGVFVVYDEAGHNTVDASGAKLGGRVVFNAVAGDHNNYTGGSGSDFFQFSDANLNGTNALTGGDGGGTDFLVVTDLASVAAADLTNVTQMEVVQLHAGGTIVLLDTLSNTGSLEAQGSSAADTIDGSPVSSFGILFKGGGGADALKGGAENDLFAIPDSAFLNIDGGDGFDTIELSANFSFSAFDLNAHAAMISFVEAISLDQTSRSIISIDADDVLQINPISKALYVYGPPESFADITGDGWSALEADHINPAISPTRKFVHFQNTNGSDLYIGEFMGYPLII